MPGTSFSNPQGGRGSSLTSHPTWAVHPGGGALLLTPKKEGLREQFPAVTPCGQQCSDCPPWFAQDWKDPWPMNPLKPGGRRMGLLTQPLPQGPGEPEHLN